MTLKEQITLSRSGERAKTSGHFYGRLRAVQGICGLSYMGGYGGLGANGLKECLFYVEIPCINMYQLFFSMMKLGQICHFLKELKLFLLAADTVTFKQLIER